MSQLIPALEKIIKDNYGVFDKFTGDGILAFFPDFFSGEDSHYFALKAAKACHEEFQSKYKENAACFSTIKANVGVGIGIDYGEISFVTICDDLTAVGTPVVYACRLGGAPANQTLLNQGAIDRIKELYVNQFKSTARTLEIKGELTIIGYDVELSFNEIKPKLPHWVIGDKNSDSDKESLE